MVFLASTILTIFLWIKVVINKQYLTFWLTTQIARQDLPCELRAGLT